MRISISSSNCKKGQYVICSNDKDKKNHWYTKPDENSFLGLKEYQSKKLPSITKGEIYQILDKKTEKKTKKSRFGGSFETTVISFKIKSNKGTLVWIPTYRFEYNPEVEKNQIRYERLSKMLK